MTEVTPEIVREFLDYDHETGELTWRNRDRKWFKTDRAFSTWNSRYAGTSALAADNGQGYLRGQMLGKYLFAHRVAYAHSHGAWPEQEVDHINHNPSDNRICNLRECSHQDNNRNQSIRSDNSSGHTGVHWDKKGKHWQARITKNGRYVNLGCFETKGQAIRARAKASRELGFHTNHGA